MSRCPWCGTTDGEVVVRRRDRLGGQFFSYLRCRHCGLICLESPLSLEERARYYPPTYEPYQEPRQNWLLRWGLRRYWLRRIRAVDDFLALTPGRVLDVGCATGQFLGMLQQRGWQVVGVEPNPGAAARTRERLGAGAVHERPFEQATFEPTSFDLVTLWDVLDHLQSPPSALLTLHGWLQPRGLLVLGVFDLASWDARLFGRAWLGWDAPRHTYLFPEETLRAMLKQAGFEVIATRSLYGGYGSLVTSLDTLLQERLGASWAGRVLRRLVGMRIWRYLLWPYFRLAEWAGRGPIRTYFCRPAG